MEIKYSIDYEHLRDGIANPFTEREFVRVRDYANENQLDLSDDDFKRLFKLAKNNEDVRWIIQKMKAFNMSLVDVLVLYLTSGEDY